MGLILIVLLIVLLLGGLPNWHGWGYGPSGLLGVVLLVVLILILTNHIPWRWQ